MRVSEWLLSASTARIACFEGAGAMAMRSTLFLIMATLASTAAKADGGGIQAFESLKTLVGEWKREGDDGNAFRIDFSTTANGTVLIENWMRNGKSHSLTLYHADGDAILATHYCPQGNQPRLRLIPDNSSNEISFDLQDVTNLASADASHQHKLSFDIISGDEIVRKESYQQGGEVAPSQMRLVRITEVHQE